MTRKLLFINGLAIIGVVIFHAVGMGFVAMFAWAGRYLPPGETAASQVGSISYYALRLLEQLVIPCIPIFLFVSGYFVSVATARTQATLSWQVVFSRIRTLVIPYLLWTVIVLLLGMLEGKTYPPSDLLEIFLTGRANQVLYFVPFLIQFYLLSPFIVSWAKRNWVSLLVVAVVLQILVQLSHYPLIDVIVLPIGDGLRIVIPKWFFLARVLWFPLGVIIGLNTEIYKGFILRYKSWWLPVGVLLLLIAMLEWELLYRRSGELWLANVETIIDSLYSIAVLFGLLVLDSSRFRGYAFVSSTGSKSYGIYLTHALFIEYASRAIYHLAPALLGNQLILQSILISVGLLAPLAMMAVTDRTPLRRWYSYLYG